MKISAPLQLRFGLFSVIAIAIIVAAWICLSTGGINRGAPVVRALPVGSPAQSGNREPLPLQPGEPAASRVPAAFYEEGVRFREATNYRAFALSALRNPREGGLFFAKAAVLSCSADRESIDKFFQQANREAIQETATISDTRLNAQHKLIDRCLDFTPQETVDLYRELSAAIAKGADPYVDALAKLTHAYYSSNREQYESSLKFLIDSQAFFALGGIGGQALGMLGSNDIATPNDRWFDGKNYGRGDDPSDLQMYMLALQLATCSSDSICQVDQEMVSQCAYHSICESSREQFISNLADGEGFSTENKKNLGELAAEMRRALTSGEISRFFRPT